MTIENNELMRHAYAQTIVDLKIELLHTEWWRFRELNRLSKEIERYEDLMESLNIND
jgi:hypothetical protein